MPHFGRNDHATESERLKTGENVGIIRNSVVLDYPWGTRKGRNFALGIWMGCHVGKKNSIIKGKGLNLRAESPRIKLYWVAPRCTSECNDSNSGTSRAPFLSKFGNLPIREILVVTSAYDGRTDSGGGGGESQDNARGGVGVATAIFSWRENCAVLLGNRCFSWREIAWPSSLLKKRFL